MNTENAIIDHYESMAVSMEKMLAAARRNDWDGVIAEEQICGQIIQKLKGMGDLAPRDPQLRKRKAEIIRKVLSDDAEIRNLADPWMRRLEGYLKTTETTNKLGRAYGVSGPGNE